MRRAPPMAIASSLFFMSHREKEIPSFRASATRAELAAVATMLQRLKDGLDLRQAKVRRVRNAIRAHEYENSLKLKVAAERMETDFSGVVPETRTSEGPRAVRDH